jgi:hypothetical protein
VKYAFVLWDKVMGDCNANGITAKMAEEFRDKLSRLPARMTLKPEFKDKSVKDILEMKDVIPMSDRSVNKNMGWITGRLAPESRSASKRNAGRHHAGTPVGFSAESRSASSGIRKFFRID